MSDETPIQRLVARFRPGSRPGSQPVSRTKALDSRHHDDGSEKIRLVPQRRSDEPDWDEASWPIADATFNHEPLTLEVLDGALGDVNEDKSLNPFPRHEPDDPNVLRKLFGTVS